MSGERMVGQSPRAWLFDTTVELTGCKPSIVSDGASLFGDLDGGEFVLLDLATLIEDHDRIRIEDLELTGITTFGDAVALLERKVGA